MRSPCVCDLILSLLFHREKIKIQILVKLYTMEISHCAPQLLITLQTAKYLDLYILIFFCRTAYLVTFSKFSNRRFYLNNKKTFSHVFLISIT